MCVRTVSLGEKVRVAKLFEVQVVGVVLHVVTVGHDRGQHARRRRDVIDRRENSVHPKVLVARRGAVDLDALANLRLFARVEKVAAELQCLAVLAPDVLDVPFHDPVRAQRPEPAARAVLLRGLDVPVPLGFVLAALAHGEPLCGNVATRPSFGRENRVLGRAKNTTSDVTRHTFDAHTRRHGD